MSDGNSNRFGSIFNCRLRFSAAFLLAASPEACKTFHSLGRTIKPSAARSSRPHCRGRRSSDKTRGSSSRS